MLIKRAVLDRIVGGEIDLVFRRWKRTSVKAGSTVLTSVGLIEIGEVKATSLAKLRAADAKRAGFETRAALVQSLSTREGTVFQITVRHAGADPRIALRDKPLTAAERSELDTKLGRLPWARAVLELLRDNPEVRAGDLAEQFGLEKKNFKQRVRRLKALGLTESLRIGYRLSPRGQSYLAG